MNQLRFFIFICMLLACNSIIFSAQAANNSKKKELELGHTIERQVLTLNFNQVKKFQLDYSFSTFHGMYAYRELLLWAQSTPQPQRNTLLTLIRTGLEAVVRDSGMGIPFPTGPETQATGLLFNRGLPRYAAQPDFTQPSTLKWTSEYFDWHTAPESVGQSLAAKSLYQRDDSDTSDESTKLKEIMLASSLREFQSLLALLKLGSSNGAHYMPALLKLENDKWSTVEKSSQLYGQMSLIQGLSHLHNLLSLASLQDQTIEGKRIADWRKEVYLTLDKILHTTIKLHFDTKAGSFVSTIAPLKGATDRISAEDAGYTLEVLADLASSLPKGDALHNIALKHLTAQADFIIAHMEGKSTAPKLFMLKNNQSFAGILMRLEDQLSIVNGLLAAEQISSKEAYGTTALSIFNTSHPLLWSATTGIFRSAAGQTVSAYDGRMLGLALSTWRRMEKLLPPGEARKHGDHLIDVVLMQGGMQQAESPAMGEIIQPEAFIRDELPQLLKSVASLKKEEQSEAIAARINKLTDQNNNSVPGCRFGGGPFGIAPVLITQTSIKTPFDAPPSNDTTPRSSP